MGAAKAHKTELKIVVPSTRAFDEENPQADMAGAFGFSEDLDLRKGVLLRNLFLLITADDEVPQTFKWARDITSLSAIAKLDKMTRLIVATAGFVSSSKVWREGDLQKLSTDELRETAVQHVVRRGMVRALFAVTDSSCIKHTLTGVLFRAAFDKQGGVYSFNLLKDTVQGLQDLDASTCVLFADEVDRPVDAAAKIHTASFAGVAVWVDAMGGGMWMDATTALTNIVACGMVEKQPLLQNVHANTAMSRQDFNGDGIRLCGY